MAKITIKRGMDTIMLGTIKQPGSDVGTGQVDGCGFMGLE